MKKIKTMTDRDIYEVVVKLCGEVEPKGESYRDIERYENMEKFISVFREMHRVIDDVAYRYKDSPHESERRIGKLAEKQIDSMGIED